MKKKMLGLLVVIMAIATLTGCTGTQADRASYNLSKEADSFNVIRQLTVINCLEGDVLFQMTGKLSITADREDNQLEVIVEDEYGNYQKHLVGLSDNVSYVVEDTGSHNVDNYKYTLNFNPKMWLPVGVDIID